MSVTAVPLQPVKSSYKVWLWLGIIVAIAAAIGLAWVGTREQVARVGTNDQFLAWNKTRPGVKTTASGLQYQLLKGGEGATAQEGDVANVSLSGRLRDGTIFQPQAQGPFQVSANAAIPGFVEALKLMNKGARYRIWLSPKLGYGDIPGGLPELKDQTLIFDIEMSDLISAAEMQARMMQQQMMQGGPPPGGPGGDGPPSGPPSEAAPKGEAPKQ